MMARVMTNANEVCGGKRIGFLVFQYKNLRQAIDNFHSQTFLRNLKLVTDKETFFAQNNFENVQCNVVGTNAILTTSSALKLWAESKSFYICDNCNSIIPAHLPYNFAKNGKVSKKKKCKCKASRYKVPRYNEIPDVLKNLSIDNIKILRPFILDCGPYEREAHGYRVKTGMVKLSISKRSVIEKIRDLPNHVDRCKCRNAYEFLIVNPNSHYAHFVNLRNKLFEDGTNINTFDFSLTSGIECALWPNLYPFSSWCESCLSGQQSRLSMKIAFCTKLFSEILDFGLSFELLQWQYDRAMYKVVSGVINAARFLNCSPARALDAKPFSPTYWQWQHRFLLDAVEQFGLPDIFITISPYEWSFPFGDWISSIRYQTGLGPTQLPGFETFHITHVLEQIIRGYLCGTNNQKWSSHIFSYNRSSKQSNVKTFFYRFEFQKRGTVHVHMLVWLYDMTKIKHELVRADIPSDNGDLAFLVQKLQPSNKHSHCLKLQLENSYFPVENDRQVHHLKHPPKEFALNLRAYIATLLPALQCRMDYQTTDGVAMLLRYVTSYVTKYHDSTSLNSLYSYDLEGRQAATRYLIQNSPTEPEMWCFLQSKKIAWSSSKTKRFTAPVSTNVTEHKTVQKYWQRPAHLNHLSLIVWLRQFNTNASDPKPYKQGTTLVGVKTLSILNQEFFFQFILLNLPHRKFSQMVSPEHEYLPDNLKWHVAAKLHFPDFWNNPEKIKHFLTLQGHKHTFTCTVLAYLDSLHHSYYLWKINVIKGEQFAGIQNRIETNDETQTAIDPWQTGVVTHVDNALILRDRYYNTHVSDVCENLIESGSESESDEEIDDCHENNPTFFHNKSQACIHQLQIEWQKPVIVLGDPGSGKTHTICYLVKKHFTNSRNILLALPTAFLASRLRGQLPNEVVCDTVHAIFNIPVDTKEKPSTNWGLSCYDLIIIDEISMISQKNFAHVLETFNRLIYRPVLLLGGDIAQQQPFEKFEGKFSSLKSPLSFPDFIASCYKFLLYGQHRIEDSEYFNILSHIRHWQPTQSFLDNLQKDRVIFPDSNIQKDVLIRYFIEDSHTTILTFSNAAADHANNIILQCLFATDEPLAYLNLDDNAECTAIYKGMKVMITQNRDKANNVVNGEVAYVHTFHKNTVFLKMKNNLIAAVYPVTFYSDDESKTCFPFRVAYAITICKSQGQTLPKVIVWFDKEIIPPGTGYVALSRVRKRADILFLTPLKPNFFIPVR